MQSNMDNIPVNKRNTPAEEVAATSISFIMNEFETSDIGMILLDKNARIKKFNAAWSRMLCIDEMSAVGKRFGDGFRCVESLLSGCGKGSRCIICNINSNVKKVLGSGSQIADVVYRHEFALNDQNYSPLLKTSFYPVTCGGEDCVLITAEDITDRA